MIIENTSREFLPHDGVNVISDIIRKKSEELHSVFVMVGGGVGSGKTSLITDKLQKRFGTSISVVSMDDYFKNEKDLEPDGKGEINRNEPRTLDFEGLISDIEILKKGYKIQKPIYDFVSNSRVDKEEVNPNTIVVLEGIFMLHDAFHAYSDLKVFVDADASTRLLRTLFRDIYRKQAKPIDIVKRYFLHTKYMHEKHVEATKKNADIIIKNDLDTTKELPRETLKKIFIS